MSSRCRIFAPGRTDVGTDAHSDARQRLVMLIDSVHCWTDGKLDRRKNRCKDDLNIFTASSSMGGCTYRHTEEYSPLSVHYTPHLRKLFADERKCGQAHPRTESFTDARKHFSLKVERRTYRHTDGLFQFLRNTQCIQVTDNFDEVVV